MILLIVSVVVIFLVIVYMDKKAQRAYPNITGPVAKPIVGNAVECAGNNAEFFQVIKNTWYEYGTRYRVFIGPLPILLLSDPKDVEVVLSGQEFIEKSKEYDFLHPWLGSGLLTSKGEKWRKHRKIITPAFHFKILDNFIEVFENQGDILIGKLRKYCDGSTVDIYPIIAMCALDIISETAMGVSINAQKDTDSEYVRAVKDMCEIIFQRFKNPAMRLDIIFRFTKEYQTQKKALHVLHSFTDKMIQERRALLEERKETMSTYTTESDDIFGRKKKMAFLDLLLLSQIDGKPLSDKSIREEVDTFLFEGHDTTTSALSFALYLLSHNPDAQQKIFEEQQMIFGSDFHRMCTHSDFQDMKYLEMAIKEALRLFPSVPILGRKTLHDTKINDFEVSGGTSIVLLVYSMNRNPEVFPNPDTFIPERFSIDESTKRNPFSMVSFSAGSRNCIGQKFAMLEMKSGLSKIIRNFELLPANRPIELRADLILKSVNGICIKLKPRQ